MQIEGPCYVRHKAWGHFLNEHYLFAIEDKQKKGRKQGGDGTANPFKLSNPLSFTAEDRNGPRLYEYLNGGSPDA
jgi:hypothetical protein